MKGATVEQSDLVGDLERLPIEVVQEMVNEQVRQGNKADVGVLQECACVAKDNGGFNWCDAIRGEDFWDNILYP